MIINGGEGVGTIITIVQSYSGRCHKFVAVRIVTSAQLFLNCVQLQGFPIDEIHLHELDI